MSFSKEPAASKIFIFLIVIIASIFIGFHSPDQRMFSFAYLFFVLLHIFVDQLDVLLPRGNSAVSVSFAVDLALIILFGPTAAAYASLTTVLNIRTFKNFNESWYKMLFNASQMVLANGLAGHAYLFSGGQNGVITLPADLLPILVSTIVFFFHQYNLSNVCCIFFPKSIFSYRLAYMF